MLLDLTTSGTFGRDLDTVREVRRDAVVLTVRDRRDAHPYCFVSLTPEALEVLLAEHRALVAGDSPAVNPAQPALPLCEAE